MFSYSVLFLGFFTINVMMFNGVICKQQPSTGTQKPLRNQQRSQQTPILFKDMTDRPEIIINKEFADNITAMHNQLVVMNLTQFAQMNISTTTHHINDIEEININKTIQVLPLSAGLSGVNIPLANINNFNNRPNLGQNFNSGSFNNIPRPINNPTPSVNEQNYNSELLFNQGQRPNDLQLNNIYNNNNMGPNIFIGPNSNLQSRPGQENFNSNLGTLTANNNEFSHTRIPTNEQTYNTNLGLQNTLGPRPNNNNNNLQPTVPLASFGQNYNNNNNNNVNNYVMKFAWDLFKGSKLPNPLSNYILCPISPQLLLALLADASVGATKEQFETVIGDVNPESLKYAIDRMKASNTRNELEMATAIFVSNDYRLNRTFVEKGERSNVSIITVNFENGQQTSNIINNWAAESTQNNINRIVNGGAQFNDLKLLLSNAVYFRGFWKYPFNNTISDAFYESSNSMIRTTFMKQSTPLRYGEYNLQHNLGFKWVELPYEDDNFSMILLLPKTRFTLNDIITRGMSTNDFTNFLTGIDNHLKKMIHLSLPKFSLRSTFSLANTLLKLGLVNPFTINSNIPYLAENGMVRLSDAVQHSFLSVDEKGSVATATTTFSVITLSIKPLVEEITFNINEPFLSIIIDKKQNIPLFISKIYNQ